MLKFATDLLLVDLWSAWREKDQLRDVINEGKTKATMDLIIMSAEKRSVGRRNNWPCYLLVVITTHACLFGLV